MRSSLFVSVILHTVLILLLLRLNVLPRNLSIVPVVHASRIQNAAVLLQAPRYPLYGAIRISQPATLVPARAQSNSNDVAWRTSPQSIPQLPDPSLQVDMPSALPESANTAAVRKLLLLESEALDGMLVAAPALESIGESPSGSDSRSGRSLKPARLLKRVIPVYPPLAKRARVQGVVVLEASIGESGAVENVNVISGHPLLIPAALDAIRQWQYDPATLEGIPIRASVNITVNFNLHFAE